MKGSKATSRTRNLLTMLGATTGMFVFSCTGNIGGKRMETRGEGAAPPKASPSPGPGAAPGPITIPVPDGSALDECGTQVDPGFVGSRRLSRVEINNSLRDLLGDGVGDTGLDLPDDDSILAEQARVSALTFEKLEAGVDRAIEGAWLREASATGASPRLQICRPDPGDSECTRTIVGTFARKAWRRPVEASELEALLNVMTESSGHGADLASGIKTALKAVLLAPDFLYRVETETNGARSLNAHEIAVRLSYLVWSTTPDDRLSALADDGSLSTPDILASELDRLLADRKAHALARGFSRYWLGLYALDSARPDPTRYPQFGSAMRDSMSDSTIELIRAFINEDRPVAGVVDADFAFVDESLAALYGWKIDQPMGPLTRVVVPPGPRRGLLGHAAVLTMTSMTNRTSPVKRGKWVLGRLLCSQPPAPPPNTGEFKGEALLARTERERLAIHRSNPQCAVCHSLIDPIGLGMENFDMLGQHRSTYDNGADIDASGELVGKGAFSSFEELRELLTTDERISSCAGDRLFTYAVGREPKDADRCVQATIRRAAEASGAGLRSMLLSLVQTPMFAARRPAAQTESGR